MTIEQAAEYLREKAPAGADYYISQRAAGRVGGDSRLSGFVTINVAGTERDFRADTGMIDAVRAAVDWAKGQEAGK